MGFGALFGRGGTRADAAPRRVYLHIGMNKAGSSAIQRTLAAHEARLWQAGVLYPRAGRSRSGAHHLLSHVLGFSQGEPPPASSPREFRDIDRRIAAEARKRGAGTVILSSEVFTTAKAVPAVREYFRDEDLRIVVYLRRHDHWWLSCYSQGVRMQSSPPWGPGFEAWYAHQRKRPTKGDYRWLLAQWAAVFGEERLIVRPYEREQNAPDIVADFLSAIGLPALAEDPTLRAGRHNPSLGERELLLIDAVQHAGLPEPMRRRLVKHIAGRPGQRAGAGLAPPGLRRQMVEEQLEDYAWIARNYLGRNDGRLFLEPLPDPDQPWAAPEPLSPRELIEAVAAAARWP